METRKSSLTTIIILFLIMILLIVIFPMTYSKYETTATSNANTPVAYYILDAGYQYLDVKIPDLAPSNTPFVYNFTISNNKNNKRTETLMEYDLSIVTTTNLQLNYELYINENYQSPAAVNRILNTEIKKDDDDTYFKTMTTNKGYFTHEYNETNNYTLLIYFPIEYSDYQYQDIIESIFLIIESKQIVQ